MPATCSCYRVGPDAETACSRCARISRCPVGLHHAPSCFYLANFRLQATARVAAVRASRSKLSASSKTALLAPGSVNCPATSRACSARSSHSKASFNGDGIRQRRRHSVLPFGIQDSFFSARATISPVPSIVRPREAPARMVGSEPLRTVQRRAHTHRPRARAIRRRPPPLIRLKRCGRRGSAPRYSRAGAHWRERWGPQRRNAR